MTNKSWVNLHCHTTFSMLDGYGSVERYVERAKSIQMGSLAITDHGNIAGWMSFYEEAKDKGVKPIFGLEAYQARKSRFDRDEEERSGPAKNEWDQRGPYHLTILAKNATGYRNLIKLSSKAFTEGYYVKPRLDHDLLSENSEGIIVLSGCLNGELQQALLRGDFNAALHNAQTMQDIVGKENYFIEIQDHGLHEQHQVKEDTLRIAKMIGAKVVCTGDCHYVVKEDAPFHDIMLCTATGSTIHSENRFKFSGDEFYLHSYDEMAVRFEPEWLDNTCDLADMVDVNLDFNDFHFPKFPDIPKEITPGDLLEQQVWAGAIERYGDPIPEEVIERIKYELRVVKTMDFEDYFLVVGDLVRWAKDNGIRVGAGRGSAAGSILSYCLRITNLDPLRFGLMFERFLVEGRKTMPDIDLDFDDRYRERVIDYVREKYGEDRVVHIGTLSTLGARSAIRDAARALGHEYAVGDKLAKLVPPPVLGISKSIKESLKTPDMQKEYDTNTVSREVLDAAMGLEGIYRQPGIHAAGIIIAPGPIIDYIPVMVGGKSKETVVTQWTMDVVEKCGMLKIDFLGLRNLGVIDMAVENIRNYRGIDVDIDSIPMDDQKTFDLMCKGEVNGVFQIESPGMMDMTISVQPNVIDDIMAITALYRPGPMGSGMDKMYVNRKHGREPIAFAHPILEEILADSYGIMLYQEEVINVTRALTGWDAGKADDLRRIMGKKKMDIVGQYREEFVKDAVAHCDISTAVANKVFSEVEYFAGYGFNRAHAASYGILCYMTAWLKAHYPTEYMAALLTSVTDDKAKMNSYLNECKRMGIDVQPPSINQSGIVFNVLDDNTILFGLLGIDGMGMANVTAITAGRTEQDYVSVYDFMRRCDPVILNKGTIEHLVYSGALDELSGGELDVNRRSKLEILAGEKSHLGIYVTEHPLEDLSEFFDGKVSHEIGRLQNVPTNVIVKVGGIINSIETKITKNGAKMAIIKMEDTTGLIEVVAFPKVFKLLPDEIFQGDTIAVIKARIGRDGDEENAITKLYLVDIEQIDTSQIYGHAPINLGFELEPSSNTVKLIYDMIVQRPGDATVFMSFPKDGKLVTMRYADQVTPLLENDLQELTRMSNEA